MEKLSTDEYAKIMNARREAEKEEEELKSGPDHLLFKWGTLKGWNLTSEKGKELLGKYFALGSSMSAIAQHDTDEQKELIYQMVDECDGPIQSDWTGEYFTKENAKKYIADYGKEETPTPEA